MLKFSLPVPTPLARQGGPLVLPFLLFPPSKILAQIKSCVVSQVSARKRIRVFFLYLWLTLTTKSTIILATKIS